MTLTGTEPLKLWSVTTLIKLGLGTSEAIINWAVKTTAAAAIDQRRVVAAMLEAGDRDGAIEHLANVRFRKSGRARLRGTDLHTAAEAIALGVPPPIPEGGEPYIEHYVKWLERFEPRFLMSEAPVYNVTQHYAGTLDGIMELAGVPVVFDIKTTEHPPGGDKARPPFPEVALQLAAYARAEVVGVLSEQRYASGRRYYLYDATAHHEPMPQVQGALCIVLSPYDCNAVPVRIDDDVWRAFLHVRECARWQVDTSRNLFGPPLAVRAEEAIA